ncbi:MULTISPECIES: 2Fe-2S iron-sulfur cluster-binding protein [Streptomyces]|uniref:2Fe-2S iron-sulfur cluster-binding protein n=1 Tax=Streptomyces TaxID=1883 RepID=UPI002248CEEE|nr:2Fe-2S iron-sulfur cluster-binding protein [Streptomyces sp. JHD 1]MCX2971408.1 2Fe-2S iron-sulfur cluster-binding protein [Streptomyces sp. JHD 1]
MTAPTAALSGSAATAGPPAARTGFHALEVVRTTAAADDGSALAVTLRVPGELRERFAFGPGQYITVRAELCGTEVRRSYSLCSTPDELRRDGVLRVGVRAVTGGLFSTHVRERLSPGDVLEAAPPDGRFTTDVHPARRRRYAAVVAGSGITPVLSLVTHALAVEAESTFTVLYGNRSAASAMFLDELADLKDRHGPRLRLLHFLSREAQQTGPAGRRLDAATLAGVLGTLLPPWRVDEWFVCGPYTMAHGARRALEQAGVAPSTVHTELFQAAPPAAPSAPADAGADAGGAAEGASLEVRLEGRTSTVRTAPGQTILDAALSARPELPYSCRAGVCATCRARVVSGGATMPDGFTLTAEERADDYVLTCQAVPTTATLSVDYDVV